MPLASDMLAYEKYYWTSAHCTYIAGVDEAGRGPLAGPVCAAAVILPQGLVIEGVKDSKKLTAKQRETLFDVIQEKALSYSVAWGSVEEIETLNILQATMLTMKRAVEGLTIPPDMVLVDGDRRPDLAQPCVAVVKGDTLSQSIAAASILAKVSRDRLMVELSKQYPVYDFAKHKGYGTQLHREKILQYGPCEIHRLSFLSKILSPSAEKKPTPKRAVGNKGEDEALAYLLKKGYALVARNYISPYGEADLIMEKDECLVFVEVKARQWKALSRPSDSVDKRKRQKLLMTAAHFQQEQGTNLSVNMDIVEVIFDPMGQGVSYIEHIENAFGEDSTI